MRAAIPVSCFIIAKNEADRIGRTIRAVRDRVDEVIVVDSGSTDGTQAVAEAEGARVIFNPWPGFGQQKRFAEEQCRNDWLLNLDADEVPTPELLDEIAALFRGGAPPRAVYGMAVDTVYPGRPAPRPWARDHYCLRLYDRRRARFKNSTLHDSVDPAGESVGHLAGRVHHFSVRSFEDLKRKLDERATYSARHSRPIPLPLLGLRLLSEFPLTFLKYYLGRGHFTGGLTGLRYAGVIAYYRWARILRLLRRRLGGPPAPMGA